MRVFRPFAALVALSLGLVLTGCSAGTPAHTGSTGQGTPSSSPLSSPSSGPSSGPSSSSPAVPDPLTGLTIKQIVGQLFMVGTTATAAERDTLNLIRYRHAGSVFLSGRSFAGVAATKRVVSALDAQATRQSTGDIPLLVATDQEGGQVQVLRGPGFTTMPSGLQQGSLAPAILKGQATTWAAQLASAGVNLNLAPVVDVIGSAAQARTNPPIGAFDRELGYGPASVESHADAIRAGMTASGVQTVLKHFPGLGYVTKNTDTSSGVVDDTVGATGANIDLYRDEIGKGATAIMVSSAVYAKIDAKNPAVFSSTVVTGLLSTTLGFHGLVMTDDMSGAVQVAAWTPAQRAIKAITAGCDLVLVSKYPDVAAAMVDAVVAKATTDPAFAAQVEAAARRVIAAKAPLRD